MHSPHTDSLESRLTPLGYMCQSCGYCKNGGGKGGGSRASYYFKSDRLTVDVYQALVDRGWRRSGALFYKPDVLRHCCPHYTIRLPAADFKPSKDHRKAVNKWNDHVLGSEYKNEAKRLYPVTKAEKASQKGTFDFPGELYKADTPNVKTPPAPAHRFTVSLEPASFSQEKYDLFANYQQHVHADDDVSPGGFRRFLCTSPLQSTSRQVDGKEQLLGSFHQCYRLDGRLIAVGVLDLLPHAVSGVYFMYHSDFSAWQFGKLSALREAALALEGGYQYYYMGYYIHSCPKMRYKGTYKPQYVLDPESYAWNPLEGELSSLLDTKAYVSLAREKGEVTCPREFTLLDPKEAEDATMHGESSLWEIGVPGLTRLEDIDKGELGKTKIHVLGHDVRAENLVIWDRCDIAEAQSIKRIVAELVAFLGPEVAKMVRVVLE